MGSTQTNEQGPDLAAGVPSASVTEDKPFLGHVGDDPVVLVRRGEEVFALSATCAHYGVSLAGGLVVGETIRCPAHHACFSLHTGEALGAPALGPVARWHVEEREGLIRVTSKDELADPPRTARGGGLPSSVVIVGAGAAGDSAAELLRREGYTGPVALVDPDAAAPYDRPNLSKDYLAGTASEEWLPIRQEGFYAERRIDRVVAAVDSIDTGAKMVRLSDGRSLPYGALLLATGASPVRLRVPGAELEHVHYLRSLGDCHGIVGGAEAGKKAVVIGASFIGMEVAASLRARKMEVTVVAPGAVPFERTLGDVLGRALQTAHEREGVRFQLGRSALAIEPAAVVLDDGTRLDADLVVVGVGVRPQTGLAQKAGLSVDNGVLVDEHLKTSADGVYAAGDIASYPDPRTGERVRVEHWVAAQRQGQAAARNILGMRKRFIDPPFFWTNQWDVRIAYVGIGAGWDEARATGDAAVGDVAIEYLRRGEVRALATIGRDLENLRAEARWEAAAVAHTPPRLALRSEN